MKKTLKISIIALITVFLISFIYIYFCGKTKLTISTENGPTYFRVEKAITPEQQQTGLMHRRYLAPKTGMIFLFKPVRHARMWMKNTLIPLDMIFFDYNGKIVHIHYNAKPQDETIISPNHPVAGVLEVNAGEAKKYGIVPGNKLDLSKF